MSRTIKFTIKGNHEDPHGNPLPKIKKTRNSYWTKEAQRYAKWKAYVQAQFLSQNFGSMRLETARCVRGEKPIRLAKSQKAHMSLKISWKNGAHGDPENVFGSIADALFENDKNLDGSFESTPSENGIGRVEAEITVHDINQI